MEWNGMEWDWMKQWELASSAEGRTLYSMVTKGVPCPVVPRGAPASDHAKACPRTRGTLEKRSGIRES